MRSGLPVEASESENSGLCTIVLSRAVHTLARDWWMYGADT